MDSFEKAVFTEPAAHDPDVVLIPRPGREDLAGDDVVRIDQP
jgi:hypothetical protein